MNQIGIISPPGRGHLYPATALGRRLKARGFEVTVFDRVTSAAVVRASGLAFKRIDCFEPERPPVNFGGPSEHGPNSVAVLSAHAALVLLNANRVLANARIEALIVDQADLASGSVAERLQIPFFTVSMFPPVLLNDDSPPFLFPWLPRFDEWGRRRNRRGNELFCHLLSPITTEVNRAREGWRLPPFHSLNQFFSKTGIITQLPAIMEFPRERSTSLPISYTGPFYDGIGRPSLDFPWERLNGKPLVYASMGTVRCFSKTIFETIVAASRNFDCQLVMTLGGMNLRPQEIENLPESAIVVHFAPQTELIRRARLCICHGGINTVLDSVANGVPLIILPVADDQPGVAARIAWLGVGLFLPIRQISIAKLKELMESILLTSTYLECVRNLKERIAAIDGLGLAADIIQSRLA